MASLEGFRFDITGASGSQGLLGPKESWRAYVFPRGAHAAQDSTGTLITVDSASAAGRFAANNWIQVGLATANIRQVAAVGGDSFSVSGAAITVSENDRIYLIGTTQPTVTGGSATYTVPNTIVRKRDDDSAATYTNSMVTSSSTGLIQGFASVNFYDVMIQDGNQSNQASIINMPVGVVGGISSTGNVSFTGGVSISGSLDVDTDLTVDGSFTVGSTLTIVGLSGNFYHTGTAKWGNTVTMDGAFGVTGSAVFGDTISVIGTSGNYYHTGTAKFGNTTTIEGAFGVTGTAVFGDTTSFNAISVFGATASFNGPVVIGATATTLLGRMNFIEGTSLSPSGVSLTGSWGTGETTTIVAGANDTRGTVAVQCGAGGGSAQDGIFITFTDGAYGTTPTVVLTRWSDGTGGTLARHFMVERQGTTMFHGVVGEAPAAGNTFGMNYWVMG